MTISAATPSRLEEGRIQRAYVIALDPTQAQQRLLISNLGAARFAYNSLLSLVIANMEQRAAERSYGIAEQHLTPAMSWTKFSLGKQWNSIKGDIAPWWEDNIGESYRHGAHGLAQALDRFWKSKSNGSSGVKVGFPRFKSRAS